MLWRKRIGGTVPTAMEAAPRGFYRACGRPVIQSGRADFRAAGRGAAATKRT